MSELLVTQRNLARAVTYRHVAAVLLNKISGCTALYNARCSLVTPHRNYLLIVFARACDVYMLGSAQDRLQLRKYVDVIMKDMVCTLEVHAMT